MTRAQAAGPILTLQFSLLYREAGTLCARVGPKSTFNREKYSTDGHQEELTSRHIENRHPVVYSPLDNKVFKFDAT
jgi:hypothetical protein